MKELDENPLYWYECKYEELKPRNTKQNIVFWTADERKMFLSFLIFYFDKMDIFPHGMENGTFNFMAMYVQTKNNSQCHTRYQGTSRSRKLRVFQIIEKTLKDKKGKDKDLEKWKESVKRFIIARI